MPMPSNVFATLLQALQRPVVRGVSSYTAVITQSDSYLPALPRQCQVQ